MIGPRLKVEAGLDEAERILLNESAPHARQMRRTAVRLQAGELFAVEARRVQTLPGAECIAWLADWRGGVIVGTNDTLMKAPARMPVQI